MGSNPSIQWFLGDENNRMGPYTTDQIQSFLKSGHISLRHKVTAAHLNGKWVTLQEALGELAGMSGAIKSFVPPPRPFALKEGQNAETEPMDSPGGTDPTLSLFDALQAAKERKKAEVKVSRDHLPQPEVRERNNRQLWLVASVAIILGTLVWGTVKLLDFSQNVAKNPLEHIAPVYQAPKQNVPKTNALTSPASNPFGTGSLGNGNSLNSPNVMNSSANSQRIVQPRRDNMLPRTVSDSQRSRDRDYSRDSYDRGDRGDREYDRERDRDRDYEKADREREMDQERERERERDYGDRQNALDVAPVYRAAPGAAAPPNPNNNTAPVDSNSDFVRPEYDQKYDQRYDQRNGSPGLPANE